MVRDHFQLYLRVDNEFGTTDHFKSTLLHLSTLSSPPAPSFDFQLSSQDFIPLPLASVPPSPHRLPSPSVSPPIAHDDTSDETPIIDILLPSLPLPPANDLRDAPSSTPSLSDYRSATKRAQEVNRTEEARISIDLFPHSEAEDLAVYSTQPGAQEKRDGGIADELGRNEGGEVDSGIIILTKFLQKLSASDERVRMGWRKVQRG